MLTNHFQACTELRIPCAMRIATVSKFLHKQQKLNLQHILHVVHIYMDIHNYTVPLQGAAENPSRLVNESRELVFCGLDACI